MFVQAFTVNVRGSYCFVINVEDENASFLMHGRIRLIFGIGLQTVKSIIELYMKSPQFVIFL